MTASRIGHKPRTPRLELALTPEQADRDRVVDLVRRVGRERLRFTVLDLRREMETDARLQLAHPKRLYRYVQALGPTLVRPAERRLEMAAPGGAGERVGRTLRTYVLAERWAEYESQPPVLDDCERAWLALWVAYGASGEEPVATRAVTEVMQTVEALAPEREQKTQMRLVNLSKRAHPRAEKLMVPGERWTRWRPLGEAPAHPMLERWTERVRERLATEVPRPGGHATISEAVRELVVLAIRATRSADWRQGRPVKVEDLRAVAARNARAAALLDRIEQNGRKLPSLLGDMTKAQSARGKRRAGPRVVRLPRRMGELTHYDVPDEPGFELRQLYLVCRDFNRLTDRDALRGLAAEHRAAVALAAAPDPALAALGAARRAACWQQVERIEEVRGELAASLVRLSARMRDAVRERFAELDAWLQPWGTRSEAQHEASVALEPFGLTLEEVLGHQRPLLIAAELMTFVPAKHRGSGTDAECFARMTTLRRFVNPAHTHPSDPDPRLAAQSCADRVEGLVYVAEMTGSRMLAFLRRGAALLGREVRHPALLRVLARHRDRQHRCAALIALALLGEREAGELALAWMREPHALSLDIECALYVLLLLRRIDPAEWPESVRVPRNVQVRRVWIDVIRAAQMGHWLLQR